MWVQNKMGTRPETALAQRSRRCFQNFWVTTGRLNFLWSNVVLASESRKSRCLLCSTLLTFLVSLAPVSVNSTVLKLLSNVKISALFNKCNKSFQDKVYYYFVCPECKQFSQHALRYIYKERLCFARIS